MQLTWTGIQQHKPAIFDWLVLMISLMLSLAFLRLSDLTASSIFSGWMLAVALIYTTGLWLKRKPLYARLAGREKQELNVLFLLFLIIGHWVIMLGVVIVSEPAFRQLTGLPPLTDDDQRSGYSVFTAIVLSIALTWLAFKPVKKFSKPVSSNALERQELLGDILLIAGVSLLSFVVWEKSLVEAMTQMDADSFGQLFALFIFLALCYLLFYLPLRYLYLIEERSGRQAWKRLLLVFMIILLRGLFAAWQR
jgi:hypothetical protein